MQKVPIFMHTSDHNVYNYVIVIWEKMSVFPKNRVLFITHVLSIIDLMKSQAKKTEIIYMNNSTAPHDQQ